MDSSQIIAENQSTDLARRDDAQRSRKPWIDLKKWGLLHLTATVTTHTQHNLKIYKLLTVHTVRPPLF